MADERRCEECPELPGEDGTCGSHPYARLIWISPQDAHAEQALLRDMRNERITGLFGVFGVGAALSVFALFIASGSWSGPGAGIFSLLLFLLFLLVLLLLPAVLMWCRGRELSRGRPGLSVWAVLPLSIILCVLLSSLSLFLLRVDWIIREISIGVLLLGPVVVWLLGMGSLLRGKQAAWQRLHALEMEEVEEARAQLRSAQAKPVRRPEQRLPER